MTYVTEDDGENLVDTPEWLLEAAIILANDGPERQEDEEPQCTSITVDERSTHSSVDGDIEPIHEWLETAERSLVGSRPIDVHTPSTRDGSQNASPSAPVSSFEVASVSPVTSHATPPFAPASPVTPQATSPLAPASPVTPHATSPLAPASPVTPHATPPLAPASPVTPHATPPFAPASPDTPHATFPHAPASPVTLHTTPPVAPVSPVKKVPLLTPSVACEVDPLAIPHDTTSMCTTSDLVTRVQVLEDTIVRIEGIVEEVLRRVTEMIPQRGRQAKPVLTANTTQAPTVSQYRASLRSRSFGMPR